MAECEDGGEALAAIAAHRPDVAFLDIRMPELSGLDVARASEGRCRVVFTTAYDAHAIEAFGLARSTTCSSPSRPNAWNRAWRACAANWPPASPCRT